ncbi:MAG: hypothetical protein J0L82_10760 [Deltaproteobacteria bacterium]|jgi:hypothetical protein|nr:hypothetical protein [Deltaproteobacteria bacterium]
MKNTNSILVATLLALTVIASAAGCSGGRNPDKEAVISTEKIIRLSGIDFESLISTDTPSTLESSSGSEISGTGLLLAREPLSDVKIGRHFTVRGELSDGGSIRLITFAIREANQLKNGVELELSRIPGAQGFKVIAKAGNTEDDWSQFFANINPTGEFEIGIDVHNDENGEAHILVWDLKNGTQQAAFFDSAVDVNGAPGKGFGRHWAVKMNNATMRNVIVGEPRYDH